MTQATRPVVETRKLQGIVDIPENFSGEKVEILVLPLAVGTGQKPPFDPESFFAASHLHDVDRQIQAMRDERER